VSGIDPQNDGPRESAASMIPANSLLPRKLHMDPVLITMVIVLVGTFLLAFYMDWLGLWISKKEMQAQINQAKERLPK
jgi:hypothetical protein